MGRIAVDQVPVSQKQSLILPEKKVAFSALRPSTLIAANDRIPPFLYPMASAPLRAAVKALRRRNWGTTDHR
jgi:hypothetical protein